MHAIVENLGPAAGQAPQARFFQIAQHCADALRAFLAALADAGQVHDFNRGEGLDVHLRRFLADRAHHVGVVLERQPGMQAAHNVHLRRAGIAGHAHFLAHVIDGMFIRAVLPLLR